MPLLNYFSRCCFTTLCALSALVLGMHRAYIWRHHISVVTVPGSCNLVGGGGFLDPLPPWWWFTVFLAVVPDATSIKTCNYSDCMLFDMVNN